MTIRALCKCGTRLQTEDRFAGKKVLCPYCRRTILLPERTVPNDKLQNVSASTKDAISPNNSVSQPGQPTKVEDLEVNEFLDQPIGQTKKSSTSEPESVVDAELVALAVGQRDSSAEPTGSGNSIQPSPAGPSAPTVPWTRRMLMTLLDPQAIQWLLVVGGGLMVIGIIIWLASLGIFENAYVVAAALGIGNLAVLAAGCFVMLKTRYQTAGRAVAFLACVILPLNLWYYEYQGMLSLDTNLWMAAFVICWIYIGTVYLLKDPLFVFAVEAGVTLTTLLLMASLGRLNDAASLSMTLLVLALVSIHAERAFPTKVPLFSRERFGLNLFWSGQIQLAASLIVLAAAQVIRWTIAEPAELIWGIHWTGALVSGGSAKFVAGAIWLAGMYAYVYSDLIVRRLGVYTYLAAICLMMAEVTLVGWDVSPELLIVLMTATAVAVNYVLSLAGEGAQQMRRTLPPLSVLISYLAVAIGLVLHLRATSQLIELGNWNRATDRYFVIAMLVVAIGNRISAFLNRHAAFRYSAHYIMLSATGVMIGAAGLLRNLGMEKWHDQAPLLMVIPILYLLASVLRTERSVRGPLQWAAHGATAIIVILTMLSSLRFVQIFRLFWDPGSLSVGYVNLLAGLVFAQAAIFYALAAIIRRKQLNVYLAAVVGCAAVWQFVLFLALPDSYYLLLFALIGIGMLIASRLVGISEREVFQKSGEKSLQIAGPGSPMYHVGNGVLVAAFVAAILQGALELLGRSEWQSVDWEHSTVLGLTTVAGALATLLTRPGIQRWWHATGTVVLATLTFINILLPIDPWRKAEIFVVGAGLVMLIASYIAHFRDKSDADLVAIGRWLGSLAVSLTLLIAALTFRFTTGPSLPDEIGLLTAMIFMLASGASLQFKAPTLLAAGAMTVYLAVVIVELAYSPQIAIGVYLAAGGLLVFFIGLVLSIYRERLLELPERLAKREGLFKIFNWK